MPQAARERRHTIGLQTNLKRTIEYAQAIEDQALAVQRDISSKDNLSRLGEIAELFNSSHVLVCGDNNKTAVQIAPPLGLWHMPGHDAHDAHDNPNCCVCQAETRRRLYYLFGGRPINSGNPNSPTDVTTQHIGDLKQAGAYQTFICTHDKKTWDWIKKACQSAMPSQPSVAAIVTCLFMSIGEPIRCEVSIDATLIALYHQSICGLPRRWQESLGGIAAFAIPKNEDGDIQTGMAMRWDATANALEFVVTGEHIQPMHDGITDRIRTGYTIDHDRMRQLHGIFMTDDVIVTLDRVINRVGIALKEGKLLITWYQLVLDGSDEVALP